METRSFLVGLLFMALPAGAQRLDLTTLGDISFRALSVVDDSVAWISGTNGSVARTLNGGASWSVRMVASFEKADFRSLYAFDSLTAVVASVGSPGFILITKDGGLSWTTVYRNNSPEAFIDGIDFWDQLHGIAYGDPVDGRMLLAETSDGGHTWQDLPESSRPALVHGEASFAASGTAIRCVGTSELFVATGGKLSRLFYSSDAGGSWTALSPPIIQGQSSTGIFSVAFRDTRTGLIVGGDYLLPEKRQDHVLFTFDGGATWTAPVEPTGGYRECVEFISQEVVLAAGPGGVDISRDAGRSWLPLSGEKDLHVVRKARKGSLVILAGGHGKVARFR